MEASNRSDLNRTIGNRREEAQTFNNGRKKLGVPFVQRRINSRMGLETPRNSPSSERGVNCGQQEEKKAARSSGRAVGSRVSLLAD
ncbi:hypothetical protein HZ326_22234 [Fusarium oxysporum f. sp. albedinis]|nr:hypothetical protein HZ326_22234 [Fusarium oxysporum f. sp. albedinis]